VAGRATPPADSHLKLEPESLAGRVLVSFGFRLLQLWARTIRFEFEDRGEIRTLPLSQRLIGAAWHNRLLLLPLAIRRFLPHRQGAALISASRDGAWYVELVQRFRFDVVRGSSSRKGAAAMLQLADYMAAGGDVVITPDGPRGPVYRAGGGIIFLAQKTGAHILPMHFEYSSCWRLRSWDRFILPRPFCRARFIVGPTHQVAITSTEEEFEGERERLEKVLMSMVETR
jgi:lysophospholipid acyltransferase (LPLAT)-like uncharacterized protein